ncbi:MAG TPA: alanine--tRNA ligase [Dehalococcoidia bacterium]|nr:alanine--tRNA ligase [Dehalococcoidia bacterium]
MMTSDQVRQAFLHFFEEKGHKVIASSSLIPRSDPTLLLTSAGMVPFKPYFLGEEVPPSPRLASCQKCFRTTDIESVGDAGHLTFFEMLGNFSVGDYFKKEAIAWAWEFVTQRLKLSPERLWITIFLDDDEPFGYWREVGVPEERILRFGEEDNFWGPAGDSGPCGPCSEIHYDFGEEVGCGKPSCRPNCDCGRFSEIWNLVFTQYNQDIKGKRTPLPKPNIDTGMGLERTVAAVNNKPSVYETDLFVPLIQKISALAGRKYGKDDETDNAMRVIAEHSRGIAFLIADGVIPDRAERGSVLRRLLRRAQYHGETLAPNKPFLTEVAKATIELMGHVYPELKQRRSFMLELIEKEVAGFAETLNTGLELLNGVMEKAGGKGKKEISGADAFRLHDTFGFQIELTQEIAADRGFSVDLKGFEREMEKQKERARAAQPFEAIPTGVPGHLTLQPAPKIHFTGYDDFECKTTIVDIWVGSRPTDYKRKKTLQEGQEASVILETTPFYAEMGGQVGDTGYIQSPSGKFLVTNTMSIPPYFYVHQGKVVEGSLSAGDEVEAIVDEERRLDIARNHTATHLLQFALRQVLGEDVWQRGSLVMAERFSFDFSYLKALTKKQIADVNAIVNEKIRQNLKVEAEEIPYEKAKEEGAIALFDEKYGDVVRVVRIGKPRVSAELCGGTHVSATGEIGLFHIISEGSIGAGLRRIEAVTGRGAEKYFGERVSDSEQKASSLVGELERERKQRRSLERELARKTAESLIPQAEVIKGVTVLVAKIPSSRLEILREMSDLLRDRLKSAIVVLGTVYEDKPAFLAAVTPDLVKKGYDAGKIVKQVAGVTGGGGGGKPGLAQAGGRDKEKLGEALKLVKSLV